MSSFYLKAKQLFTEERIVNDTWIQVCNGRISGFGGSPRGGDEVINVGDCLVVPGFIDIHIHGSGGCDVMDASFDSMNTLSKIIAANGVTGFLGTTVTSSWSDTLSAFKNIKYCCQATLDGAELLGGYSEGLFFSGCFKGAHAAEYFLTPTRERLDAIIDAAGGTLRSLAIAPEVEGGIDAIRYLSSLGIKVMVGHTGASYEQCITAFKAGAVGAVHIFNQMLGLHHRQPGTVGAVLQNRDIVAELIADGVHVDPVIMELVYRLKGSSKIALVTDCMRAGGLSDGKYELGPLTVIVNNGIARTQAGVLAGSTLSLNKAVAVMIKKVGIDPLDAVHMASLTPATLLGLETDIGSIKVNKRANLAILDNDYNVIMTFVDGKIIHKKI